MNMKGGAMFLLIFIVFVTTEAGTVPRKREFTELARIVDNGETSEDDTEDGTEAKEEEQEEGNTEESDDGDGYRILIHPSALQKLARLILQAAELFSIRVDNNAIFPSHARSHHRYHECRTPRNRPGRCAHVQYCIRPKFLHDFDHFKNQVCYIDGRYLGVCCPEGQSTEVSEDPTQSFISSLINGYAREHPGTQ